jgi:hypothetical protein
MLHVGTFIAKAILFRAVQPIVRAKKFPAYQANIIAYTVAALAWKANGRVDFDLLWSHQAISAELASIRQIFRNADVRSREDVMNELRAAAGELRYNGQIREEMENAIRTAVRRSILESRGDGLALSTRSIADYKRDILKDHFATSMQGHAWAEREDSIRRFARWLGFRRTGPSIDDAARSVINGLIRDGRLESNGSQIRRRG